MGQISVTLMTSLLIFLTYYLLAFTVMVKASALGVPVASPSENLNPPGRLPLGQKLNRNIRSPFSNSLSFGNGQRMVQISRSKIPIEMDLLVDDDELYDKSKRYDDYGHMRFGKRGEDQFDDYGHMRFGKRSE